MTDKSKNSAEEERELRVQVPGLATEDLVAEEIWSHSMEGPQFAVRYSGSERVETTDHLLTGRTDSKGREIVYAPIDNDHLRKGMVLVPDGPAEATFDQAYRDACALAFEIYDCERSRQDEFRLLVAIAIGSWFLDRFEPEGPSIAGMGKFAPIISIRGRSGSGKNRALKCPKVGLP